jgi:hypothetical protein
LSSIYADIIDSNQDETLSETKHSDGNASTNSEHCRLLSLLRLILALFLGFMRSFYSLRVKYLCRTEAEEDEL